MNQQNGNGSINGMGAAAPASNGANRFAELLDEHHLTLRRGALEVLQVNVGRLCNQTCRHCHVNAGPTRTELMSMEVAERCLEILEAVPTIHTLDITGGAPEMAPPFRRLAERGHELGRRVIDRCNLTILTEPGYEYLLDFLAAHVNDVVASLPCYTAENVDKQRGDGVFARSITGLQMLNEKGYGAAEGQNPNPAKRLDLVYNPLGPSLPPDQAALEADYRQKLRDDFGIVFDNLITITNVPVGRFRSDLKRNNLLESYIDKLAGAFNPAAVEHVMCRTFLSVDYQGWLYDCDFNQMLNMPLAGGFGAEGGRRNIMDLNPADLAALPIAMDSHCLACTAGAGSSCAGALV